MTRAAKQKAARQATAAYSASQPLFDALRIGFIRVGEQKAELSIARDIVQHLHVKLPNADSKDDIDRHQRYIDCAVRAWRSATEIYADIFDSLAKVTAAEAAEGRAERNGHVELAAMAKTADAAMTAARSFTLYEEQAKTNGEVAAKTVSEDVDMEDVSNSDSDDDDSSESNDEDVAEVKQEKKAVDTTPTNPILLHLLGKGPKPDQTQPKNQESSTTVERLSDKIKYDAQGRKILWDRGAEKPNVPYGTLGSSEKKAWKAEKRRQRREKKQAKRAKELMQKHAAAASDRRGLNNHTEDTSKPINERDFISLNGVDGGSVGHVVPKVEYEDVSAEVDARLKAKEEEKAAKRKEKKRKRESGESIENEAEVEVKQEKPKAKKVRSEGLSGVGVGKDEIDMKREKKEKRKTEEEDGEVKKKRKKSKDV